MEQAAAACCRIRKVGSLCRRGACCCPIKVVKKPVIAMAVCGSAGNDRLFCFCCVRFPTPPARKPPAEPAGCNTAVYRSPGRCRAPRCPVPAAEPQGQLPRLCLASQHQPRLVHAAVIAAVQHRQCAAFRQHDRVFRCFFRPHRNTDRRGRRRHTGDGGHGGQSHSRPYAVCPLGGSRQSAYHR